jgi:hypothetical protein
MSLNMATPASICHRFSESWRRADLKDFPAIKNRGLPRSFLNNLGFCGSVLRFCLSYTPAFFKAAPTISWASFWICFR